MKKENMARFDLVRLSSEWYDLIICLLLTGISVWFLVKAQELETESESGAIGPATFPVAIAIVLIIALIFLALPSIKRLRRQKTVKPITVRRPLYVLLAIVLFAIFPIAMQTFGYFPAATVWLALFGLIAGIRNPLQLGSLVLGFLVFAWAVFGKLLGTPL